MKTHGESRRLPFKVGPMEAEGCPVTPSNGIEIQWYMSCTIPGHKSWNTLTIPGQYWHEHMHAAPSAWQSIPRSQDSNGVNTCILHLLVRVSQGPKIPWPLTWVSRGVLCRVVCNWDQINELGYYEAKRKVKRPAVAGSWPHRGVLGSTPSNCQPFHYPLFSSHISSYIYSVRQDTLSR